MFDLESAPNFINFIKVGAHCSFETKSAQVFNFRSRSAIFKYNI